MSFSLEGLRKVGLLRQQYGQPTPLDIKRLKRTLASPRCAPHRLLWAALFGDRPLRDKVASNPASTSDVLNVLMADTDAAVWQVFAVLEREDVFKPFVLDLFGVSGNLAESDDIGDLLGNCLGVEIGAKWEDQIPKYGDCKVLQPELVRITWRLANCLFKGYAYSIGSDEDSFELMLRTIDQLVALSELSRNLLRVLLRWSQIEHRSGQSLPAGSNIIERNDPVSLFVAVCLHHFEEPVPLPRWPAPVVDSTLDDAQTGDHHE